MSSNMKKTLPWALSSPDDAFLKKHSSLKGFQGSFILNCPCVFWSAQQSLCWIVPFLLSFIHSRLFPSIIPLSSLPPFFLSFPSSVTLFQRGFTTARSLINISTQHSRRRNLLFYKNRITLPFLFHGFLAFLGSCLFVSADATSGFHLKWFLIAAQVGAESSPETPKKAQVKNWENFRVDLLQRLVQL